MIYFVQDSGTGHIKIGFSADTPERIRDLQVGSAAGLVLLAVFDGGRPQERELHARFKQFHDRGEWYRPMPEVLRYLIENRDGATLPPNDNGRQVGAINTREATVRTCTVEIKAMTVTGKQVTLSVFRQLEWEQIIDPKSLRLRGLPWGRVNYFWGKCADKEFSGHLHLVWQKGEHLRRCCLEEWCSHDEEGELILDNLIFTRDAIVTVGFLTLALQQEPEVKKPDGRDLRLGGWVYNIQDPGASESLSLWSRRKYPDSHYYSDKPEDMEKKIQAEIIAAAGRAGSGGAIIDMQNIQKSCRTLAAEYGARIDVLKSSWKKFYAELSKLDQLFIAV